jgi:branched-chain amino acid transport system permease protein
MRYLEHILVMVGLYVSLGASLNLVAGYTGLLSMCHAAFYGIGAYATSLLMLQAGQGFHASLALAIVITGALSLIVAIPSLRLRGDYFVLATLGFQVIAFSVLYNWVGLTRGPYGISRIPPPSVFGLQVNSIFRYCWFSSALVLASLAVMWALVSSPFGRLLRAVRDDDIAAAALGKDVPRVKTTAFVLAAAFAAVPGGLFAAYVRYIDPTSFTLTESIYVLSIVVIGGAGSFLGPIVGAVVLVLLPEALRFLPISASAAADMRQVIYGLLLVILMRLRPQGIIGDYEFD